METELYSGLKKWSSKGLENIDEEEKKALSPWPSILQPQTPNESMDFLARSWSVSANEVSKALNQNQKKQKFLINNTPPTVIPESATVQKITVKNPDHRSITKWFHSNGSALKKKDKARAENARVHAASSVAGLAAALAAVVAADGNNRYGSKMSMALKSGTELLASHCAEMAELAGVDHDRVASIVRSALDIQSPGDLLTLTAAAATALRGEATLKARLTKEKISTNDTSMAEDNSFADFQSERENRSSPCKGDLLQQTRRGVLQWKSVSVYINKKSQVIIEIESKHTRRAFTKNKKCVVFGVCDEAATWPFQIERETMEEVYFGLKTAQGFLEFKCKNKIHKQKWVEEIRILLVRARCIEGTICTFEFLNIK